MKKMFVLIIITGHAETLFSQNVGIGTTTPVEKLSVLTNYGYGISHQANAIKLASYIDAGGAYLGTVTDNPFHLFTNNGTAQVSLGTNGFLGLGNGFPQYRLDAAGRIRIRTGTVGNIFTSSGIWMDDYRDGNTRIFLGMQDSIRLGIWGDGIPGVGWGFNFNARNGNVGIGVSNPVNKLEINGNVSATGNIIAQGNISADAYQYSSPKTFYYSMPPAAFTPTDNPSTNNSSDAIAVEAPDGSAYISDGYYGFAAPVNLPDGATVTSMKVYFVDDSPGENLKFALRRRLHESTVYIPMCTIITSGTPGNSDLTSSSISFPVITNLYHNFTISAKPEIGIGWPGSQLKIKAILLTYTMPQVQ
ncbi:MAG: hypothetical protein ACXWC7_17515 [Chitinophagaceae bacterium]